MGTNTLTFTAGFAAGDTIVIDRVTLTGADSTATATGFDTTTDTAVAIAASVKAAIEENTTLNAKYTVVDDGAGKLTLTQKAGSATALAVTATTADAGDAVAANTLPGVAPVTGVTEKVAITITGTATSAGTLTVVAGTKTYNITVANGATQNDVAAALKTAVDANPVPEFTASVSGAVVTFTSTTPNENVTDLNVTVQ